MDEAEFDKYALAYEDQHRANIAITGEEPSYFAEYKVRLFSEVELSISDRVSEIRSRTSGTTSQDLS
jgi:hypothetical protein